MNPLMNQMNNNLLQNVVNSNNPMSIAMSLLQQRNPQMFSQIENMMSSGITPQQAMQRLGIDANQFNQMVSNFSRQK